MRRRVLAASVATLSLAVAPLAAAAGAAAAPAEKAEPTVTTIAKRLVAPLSVAQAPDGTRYWTDNFAGLLYKQSPGGAATVVFEGEKGQSVEAVSADGGVLRFTTGSEDNKKGSVWTLDATGAPVLVANIAKFEKAKNPDQKIKYGLRNTPQSCLAQLPKQLQPYTGIKETHPYGTASANGVTYVADAGANAVLAISATGEVSTVAVIKPVVAKITKSAAKANDLPSCTIGRRIALESVPTDIEVGPDGRLYVTSLPGGPEDGSLGANGRVIKVKPSTGRAKTVVDGLVSPTGVAVASNGTMYVAQLFAGVISKIKAGSTKVKPYIELPLPAAVEATPHGLLATINTLPGKKPKGKVIQITP